jgi:fused signal recognition particle receptor
MHPEQWLEHLLTSLIGPSPAHAQTHSQVASPSSPPAREDHDNGMTMVIGLSLGLLLVFFVLFFGLSIRRQRSRDLTRLTDTPDTASIKPPPADMPRSEMDLTDIKAANQQRVTDQLSREELREARRARRAASLTSEAVKKQQDDASPDEPTTDATDATSDSPPPADTTAGDPTQTTSTASEPALDATPGPTAIGPGGNASDYKNLSDEEAERKAEEAQRRAEERAARRAAAKRAATEGSGQGPRSISEGIARTRNEGFIARLGSLFSGKIDDDIINEIEEALFTADLGVKTTEGIIASMQKTLDRKALKDRDQVMGFIRQHVLNVLKAAQEPMTIGAHKPYVVLVIGVNGAGKTTSLGKLAAKLTAEGRKVMLIAGDTFRAAAIEQLQEWGTRTGCTVHKGEAGSDPSAVIYDGLKRAEHEGFDVVLADTAGRLHNKKTLIDELEKIGRVTKKAIPTAPHRVVLVLDATNGQNALRQAEEFRSAIDYTGIILTKLDGTAKGGVIIGICDELKKPVHFIGIGERVEDMRPFDADEFVEALFS